MSSQGQWNGRRSLAIVCSTEADDGSLRLRLLEPILPSRTPARDETQSTHESGVISLSKKLQEAFDKETLTDGVYSETIPDLAAWIKGQIEDNNLMSLVPGSDLGEVVAVSGGENSRELKDATNHISRLVFAESLTIEMQSRNITECSGHTSTIIG